jgi:cobalamin biosynthesis Mg chelatase CobN
LLTEGSAIVTLHSAFADGLANGRHKVEILFEDENGSGSGAAFFEISRTPPRTEEETKTDEKSARPGSGRDAGTAEKPADGTDAGGQSTDAVKEPASSGNASGNAGDGSAGGTEGSANAGTAAGVSPGILVLIIAFAVGTILAAVIFARRRANKFGK